MAQFSYSFSMALLHSIWQAALLWVLYQAFNQVVFQKKSPLEKRNFLFIALTTQLAAFIFCFFIYYISPERNSSSGYLSAVTSRLMPVANTFIITRWAFTTYLVIISYKATRSIYTWYHFNRLYKTGITKPGIDLKLFTEIKAHHFGIKRKVTLWLSSTINTPVTFGFFKPVILLPVALLNNIGLQQAETLILHELTHIKTNDYLLNWYLMAIENLFFFNPFLRSLCKTVRLEREKYCDINVMAFNYPPSLYAETLLTAERIKQWVPAFQLAAVNRKKQLLHRIHFFSRPYTFPQQRQTGSIAPVLSLLVLFILFTAIVFHTNTVVANASVNKLASVDVPVINTIGFNNEARPVIVNNIVDSLVAVTDEHPPLIGKRKYKPVQHSITVRPGTDELANLQEMAFAFPAAAKENDADREIIIQEESSGSKNNSVQVYHLSFKNGQWVIQPQWMATAKEMHYDSLSKHTDSTRHRNLSSQ